MARYYDVAAAALALDVPAKWLDNLLSHHVVGGVEGGRQGVTRRISWEGLARLAIIASLARDLGVPARRAVVVAEELTSGSTGRLTLSREVALSVDLTALNRSLAEALLAAVESAATPRRGRPPRNG